jgi:three-Cys-motif partner protein
LELKEPFDQYVLIEKSLKKCKELRRLAAEHQSRKVKVLEGDANERVVEFCKGMGPSERGVIFLDPFGAQVRWSTLQAVAATQKLDLWLLVPVGIALNRMIPRSGLVPEPWQRVLTEFFGSEEWQDSAYDQTPRETLFGRQAHWEKRPQTWLSDYLRKRLESDFASVPPNGPKILHGRRGNPLYELWFAVSNPSPAAINLSIRIASDILKSEA